MDLIKKLSAKEKKDDILLNSEERKQIDSLLRNSIKPINSIKPNYKKSNSLKKHDTNSDFMFTMNVTLSEEHRYDVDIYKLDSAHEIVEKAIKKHIIKHKDSTLDFDQIQKTLAKKV